MMQVRKQNWLWLLWVGLGFFLVACGGEEAAIPGQPSATTADTIIDNGRITLNVDLEGVARSGYYNYTAVDALAGQRLNIFVTPEERFDIVVDIVDNNGNSILPNGPVDQGYQTEAILDVPFDQTGTYYIAVYPYDRNTEGTFVVRIEQADGSTPPPAEAPASVAPTAEPTAEPAATNPETWVGDGLLAYGVDASGYIPNQGISYWSFAGSPGEVVNIFITPVEAELDLVVNVFDIGGNSLLPNGNPVDETLSGEEVVTGVYIPVDSTYTIAIADYNGLAGSYSLRVAEVSEVGATGEEYGQMFGGAGPHDQIEGPVTTGGPYIGIVPEFGAASVWGMRRLPGDVLGIRVDPLDGQDVVVDVREGSTGQSIFEDGPQDMSFGSELITGIEFPNGGDFSIVIYGYTAEDVGRYEMYIIEGE